MKLTVIGRHGPYADIGGAPCSCYLVQEGSTSLVMDLGPGSLGFLRKHIDIRDITAFYFTHMHYDHVSDFLALHYLLDDLDHKVKVIVQKSDLPIYPLLFDHPRVEVVNIDESSRVSIGGLELSFSLLKHPIPNYGIRIKGEKRVLCYTGDTMYFPKLIDFFRGADAVLADCSKPADYNGPHINVTKAIELEKETGARILATHITPGKVPYQSFKDVPNMEIVEMGKTYSI